MAIIHLHNSVYRINQPIHKKIPRPKGVSVCQKNNFLRGLLFPLPWALAIVGPEGPEENGVVPKPGLRGGLQNGHPVPDELGGELEPPLTDVLDNGAAVDFLKSMHQVEAAQVEGTG